MRAAPAAVLALAVPTRAKTVRVFAVGNKVRVDDVVTPQMFHDKMLAMMDRPRASRRGLIAARPRGNT